MADIRIENVQFLNEMGFCTMQGHDKYGRSVSWNILRNFVGDSCSPDQAEQFMVMMMDYCSSRVGPRADQIIQIFDLADCGYKNMYPEVIKRILALSQVCYVMRVFRIYFLNSSFTTRMIYKSLQPLISERAR